MEIFFFLYEKKTVYLNTALRLYKILWVEAKPNVWMYKRRQRKAFAMYYSHALSFSYHHSFSFASPLRWRWLRFCIRFIFQLIFLLLLFWIRFPSILFCSFFHSFVLLIWWHFFLFLLCSNTVFLMVLMCIIAVHTVRRDTNLTEKHYKNLLFVYLYFISSRCFLLLIVAFFF